MRRSRVRARKLDRIKRALAQAAPEEKWALLCVVQQQRRQVRRLRQEEGELVIL